MKSLARSFVYWPNIEVDVETFVHQYHPCVTATKSLRKTALESWPVPMKPWDRIHIDYISIITTTWSWSTRIPSGRKSSEPAAQLVQRSWKFCKKLSQGMYGNPHTLVSGNGTQFANDDFKQFCEENGIQHLTTAPYHPQSSGQAERFVDTLKRGLKKLVEGEKTVTFKHLQTFLSACRSTPNRSAPDGDLHIYC